MRKIRWLLVGYIVIALFAGWPILSVAIAASIASWNGCTLHEGSVNPCVVYGQDIGGLLYSMGMMGWFMLGTIPIGAILFVVWTVVWTVWHLKRRRTASAGTKN